MGMWTMFKAAVAPQTTTNKLYWKGVAAGMSPAVARGRAQLAALHLQSGTFNARGADLFMRNPQLGARNVLYAQNGAPGAVG